MIYESDGVRIDTAAFRVERDGVACGLEPKAFDLLVYLVRHAGRVLTKTQILDDVWGGVAVTDNALTRVVAQLRRALRDGAREARFIETVPTRGYRWLPPVVEQADGGPAAPLREVAPVVVEAERAAVRTRPSRRDVAFAAGVVLVVAFVGGLWAWTARTMRIHPSATPPAQVAAAFPVQITTERALDLFPSGSPDGKSMIFASDRSGAFELYLRPLARGGAVTRLTTDGQQNVEPSWSPDGDRVAFHSMSRGGIWIMPALGGAARQVSPFGSAPAWSPDGRALAFQSDPLSDVGPAALQARPGSTIWIVPADSSAAPRALTQPNQPAGGHASPVWTRDGAEVVFVAQAIKRSELCAVRVDDGRGRRLIAIDATASDPVVAADGRYLLAKDGAPVLWSMRFDSRVPLRGPSSEIRIPAVDNVRYAAPTADGRVLFSAMTLESQLVALPMDPRRDEPAGQPRAITNSSARRTTAPVISPDGRRVAYVSGARGAAPDIWVTGIDGSGTQPVTTSPEPDMRPTWLADSDGLSFVSSRNGVEGIWKTSLISRRESLLAPWSVSKRESGRAVDVLQDPRMSPDATRIAYSAVDRASGREQLRVRVLATGDDRVLVDDGQGASFPCWSPDGRLIAFEAKRDGGAQIAIVPAAGGAVRLLTKPPGEHWVHSFSPDGSKVVSADLENGVWNIAWTAVADGRRRVLTAFTTPGTFVRYPAWSPKGNAVVFEEARLRANIWITDIGHVPGPSR